VCLYICQTPSDPWPLAWLQCVCVWWVFRLGRLLLPSEIFMFAFHASLPMANFERRPSISARRLPKRFQNFYTIDLNGSLSAVCPTPTGSRRAECQPKIRMRSKRSRPRAPSIPLHASEPGENNFVWPCENFINSRHTKLKRGTGSTTTARNKRRLH